MLRSWIRLLGAGALLILFGGNFLGLARASADCYFFAKSGFVPAYNRGECEMVSGAGGAETKKESIERCKDGHSEEVLAEFKWKDGQRVNGWFTDYNHNRVEYTLQGKIAQGAGKVYSKEKKLMCELNFVNNVAEGAVKEYYPSGAVHEVIWWEKGDQTRQGPRIRLREDGKITWLECGAQSLIPEDKQLCGRDGKPATVSVYQEDGKSVRETQTNQGGRLIELKRVQRDGGSYVRIFTDPKNQDVFNEKEFSKSGILIHSHSEMNGKYEGRYQGFSEEGKLLREIEFALNKPLSGKEWFLNGALKQHVVQAPDGKHFAVKEYWDNGSLKHAGIYGKAKVSGREMDWNYSDPQGTVIDYWEDGSARHEATYSGGKLDGTEKWFHTNGRKVEEIYKAGVRLSRKEWDASGRLELSEEYYEDGSRKNPAPPNGSTSRL